MTAAEKARVEAARLRATRGPKGDSNTPPDPVWEKELAAALADVRALRGALTTASARPPMFEGCDAVDLLQREFEQAPWLIEGLITRGGITTIGGEPKTAKTWLGTELAIAVATGTPVCGEFRAERGAAAYFFAEDQAVQVRNRIRSLLAGAASLPLGERSRNLSAGRLHVRPRGMFLDITIDDDLAWIVASCRRLGAIDLLVLDPLRDISSAAEDKSDEVSRIMRSLRLIGELLNCTLVIIHHTSKASVDTKGRRPGQRLRGSGAIHGSTDSGIYLGDLSGNGSSRFRNVVDSEIKGARSAGRFFLELEVEDDEQGEAIKASWSVTREEANARAPADCSPMVAEIADELRLAPGHTRRVRELRKKPGGGKREVDAGIAEMKSQGLIEAVMRGRKHEGFRLTAMGVGFADGLVAEDPRLPS